MFQQILKTKQGKWAVALAVIAVIAAIGSISKNSMEALPGAVIILIIAAVLVVSAIKAIQNPPAAPTLAEQGIHITQEAIDNFKAYGTLPQVENCPVLLKDGELAVYACRADRIETKNRRIGTTGGGAGASFRVAKGVRIRTGGTGSKAVYGDVEMIHSGEFVVTTESIFFVASSRAFTEKMENISAVSVDGSELVIVAGKENYAMRMPIPEYACDIIKHCVNNM